MARRLFNGRGGRLRVHLPIVWHGVYVRPALIFSFLIFLEVLFGFTPFGSVVAQALTPTPTVYCPTKLPTSTSIIPTPADYGTPVDVPTLVTSTPFVWCQGVDGPYICTPTPQATYTSTPTPTSTIPVLGGLHCRDLYDDNVTCTEYDGGSHLVFEIDKALGPNNNHWFSGFYIDPVLNNRNLYITGYVEGSWAYNPEHQPTVNYHRYTLGFVNNYDVWSGDTHDMNYEWTIDLELLTSSAPNYEISFFAFESWTVSSQSYGVIDVYTYPPESLFTPTPTPTGTPFDDCGPPSEDWIDPPVIVDGICYTVIPQLEIPLPDVSSWSPIPIPQTVGVPGFRLCVDYLRFDAVFFGFSWIEIAVTAAFMIALGTLWREFRS